MPRITPIHWKSIELIKAALYGAAFGGVLLLPILIPMLVSGLVKNETIFFLYLIYVFGFIRVIAMIFGDVVVDSPAWGVSIFILVHALLFVIERFATFRFDRRKVLIVYAYIVGLVCALTIVFSSWVTRVTGSWLD